MGGFLGSPRRRRRLIRVGAVVGFAAVAVVLVTVVLPSQGGQTQAPGIGGAPQKPENVVADPQTEHARAVAEAQTSPVVARFYRDVVGRSDLAQAYTQLAANLRDRYERDAWLRGDGLPLGRGSGTGGSRPLVAFSGPAEVGWVIASRRDSDTLLAALRVVKEHGAWRVDYVEEGRGSPYVNDATFAPAGFLPGSATTSVWWWLTIPLVLVVLIGGVALVERRLNPNKL